MKMRMTITRIVVRIAAICAVAALAENNAIAEGAGPLPTGPGYQQRIAMLDQN